MKYKSVGLLFVFALLTSACAEVAGVEPVLERPGHHTENGFKNLYIVDPDKNFFSFMRMRWFGAHEWANAEDYAEQIPWQKLDLAAVQEPAEAPQISWLRHSTFLIQYQGVNILTDPVFCDRTSPFSFAGPKRYTRHVVDYSELPEIDYVVISHNHYDHLDREATEILQQQQRQPQYYVPLGIRDWLLQDNESIQPENVIEMDWGEQAAHGSVAVAAYPSQHWSARSLFDRFETLWASWRLQVDDFSLWFAGDTGYNERLFSELGQTMPRVDLALIPIGAYAPRDIMKWYHLNPEEAVLVHQHLQPKHSIGMHWGTYSLTAEKPTEPPQRLNQALEAAGLSSEDFSVMDLGETRLLPKPSSPSR